MVAPKPFLEELKRSRLYHTVTRTDADTLADMPPMAAVKAIRAGLPARAFEFFADALSLSTDELARKLGAAPRTIRQQKKVQSGLLSAENSARLMRVAYVHRRARRIFTSDEAAARWLTTPAPALDGQRPLDLLDTDIGAREVEAVLQGIAFGNVL